MISYNLHGDESDHDMVAAEFKALKRATHVHGSLWLYETRNTEPDIEVSKSLVKLIKHFEGLGNRPSILVATIDLDTSVINGPVLEPID